MFGRFIASVCDVCGKPGSVSLEILPMIRRIVRRGFAGLNQSGSNSGETGKGFQRAQA